MDKRFGWMASLVLAVLAWFLATDPDGGNQLRVQLQPLVGVLVAAPIVYYLRRFFAEGVRVRELIALVRAGNVSAGIALAGLLILTGMLFLAVVPRAIAAPLPGTADRDLPMLQAEIASRWPAMPMPSMLAAQVEQESGWREQATLKTSREEGAGYGQFTRAYRADGTLRFDAQAEVRRLDPGLANWTWADRFNPRMQLRAVVTKNRDCYRRLRLLAADDFNGLAFCDAAYNGGEAGVYAERRLCAAAGGDATRWFGHVEYHSTKSRTMWHGYGASAYEINRTHVRNVMLVRRAKYVPILGA